MTTSADAPGIPCGSCSHRNPAANRFCGGCGAALARSCRGCGHSNPPDNRFCGACGASLEAAAAAAAAPPAPAPAPAPTGPMAQRILRARAAVEGERKQVTVLFADVKGSMELAEQLDPEEWGEIMQRFFRILADGVERFEGFVDKFTGDGIMALFGAPISHEDHAQRACYAALVLQGEIARYATEVKREHGISFSTRMGIHSGEVVVGRIGRDGDAVRMEYTALGHTVGLAQRMEALASPDTCYLSAATEALAGEYFSLEDLGEFRIKGLRDPLRVHRLLGLGRARTRFDVSRSRGLTRFVGRDADMRILDEALEAAQRGNGSVIGLSAEAGTGKSRLCHEFAERCRERGLTVNFGRALAHGRHLPYLPMLEVFRLYYGIVDGDDDRVAREKLAGRLLLLDEGLRDVLPVIFEFFGIPDPARPVPPMDPDAKQRQIFHVLHRGIRDPDASARDLVVVLEDLHWLDPASEALVAAWVEAIAGSSAMLVLNYRPEYRAEWLQRPWVRQIPLAPLGPDATRELLADLLGDDASVAPLVARIHQQTSGNPFFTEEVVQALADAGHLVGERGAYRLEGPADAVVVPASVHGILAARIDRLPEREKLVLQTAAVIGHTFAEPVLREICDLPADDVRAALTALQAAEFVFERSAFPVTEHTFKHALTREVALRSQLHERRRRLHAAAARVIEASVSDKLDAQAALLAHHWEEAGDLLAAAEWQMRASRWVRSRDFAAAALHASKALELVRREPDSPAAARLGAAGCRELLALGLRVRLTVEEIERLFTDGLAWARQLDDPMAVARMHQAMSVLCTMQCRHAEALEHAGEWERAARASNDPELRAYCHWPSLAPLGNRGDLAALRAAAEWQLAASKDHPRWGLRDWSMSAQASALLNLGTVEMFEGRLPTARAVVEQCIDVARRVADLETQLIGLDVLAQISFYCGEPDESRTMVRRQAELVEKAGGEFTRRLSELRIGVQFLLEGNPAEAVDVLERACAPRGTMPRLYNQNVVLPWLAESLRLIGDTSRARALAEEAHGFLESRGYEMGAAESAVVLARTLRHDGGLTEAGRIGDLLDRADAIVAARGAHLWLPFILVERAELAGLLGSPATRTSLLARARQLFRDFGSAGLAKRVDLLLGADG